MAAMAMMATMAQQQRLSPTIFVHCLIFDIVHASDSLLRKDFGLVPGFAQEAPCAPKIQLPCYSPTSTEPKPCKATVLRRWLLSPEVFSGTPEVMVFYVCRNHIQITSGLRFVCRIGTYASSKSRGNSTDRPYFDKKGISR